MKKRRFDEEFTAQSPWLDLVNSQHWDGFGQLTDHLSDPTWIGGFLDYWQVRPGELPGRGARTELIVLRDLLRRLTERVARRRRLSRRDLDALNRHLRAPAYLQVRSAEKNVRTELEPVRRNWRWIKSRIAASFVDSWLKQADRIKICGNPECRWAFVDATKSNIRRWCKDRRCGNRERVRRARARDRAGSATR